MEKTCVMWRASAQTPPENVYASRTDITHGKEKRVLRGDHAEIVILASYDKFDDYTRFGLWFQWNMASRDHKWNISEFSNVLMQDWEETMRMKQRQWPPANCEQATGFEGPQHR